MAGDRGHAHLIVFAHVCGYYFFHWAPCAATIRGWLLIGVRLKLLYIWINTVCMFQHISCIEATCTFIHIPCMKRYWNAWTIHDCFIHGASPMHQTCIWLPDRYMYIVHETGMKSSTICTIHVWSSIFNTLCWLEAAAFQTWNIWD